jgi:hypothetical protein
MAKQRKRASKKRSTPGPKAEMLKVEGNWREAVKKSFCREEASRELA